MLKLKLAIILAMFWPAGATLLPVQTVAARTAGCFGKLTVAPGQVAVGSTLRLQGQRYSCTGPAGFLPRAEVMFYQPNYGFAMFGVQPERNGTYQQQVTIPARLRAMSDINGGGKRMVPTRPGRYYFWMTLFDVSVGPVSQALASVRVVPGTAPSMAQIRAVMARTVEVRDHRVHFVPSGLPITIRDGRGAGALTAIVGTRSPSADGAGQLTFFWFNRHFLGWDSQYETPHILKLSAPAPGTFIITYAHYAARDPLCCPSLPPVTVQSGWSGTMLIANGSPPTPGKVKVVLLPLHATPPVRAGTFCLHSNGSYGHFSLCLAPLHPLGVTGTARITGTRWPGPLIAADPNLRGRKAVPVIGTVEAGADHVTYHLEIGSPIEALALYVGPSCKPLPCSSSPSVSILYPEGTSAQSRLRLPLLKGS